MSLQGADALKRRLRAVRLVFKPIGKTWADECVEIMRPMVPVDTGRLRGSIRRKSATQRKAIVVSHYSAYFVDAGVKPHSLARRKTKGRATFAKKHPGYRARPFRARAAHEALRRKPMGNALIDEWNRAA